MPNRGNLDIIDRLSTNISDEVGNMHEDNLEAISSRFDDTLNNALKKFNSSTFDDDGFIRRMRGLDLNDSNKEVVKSVLNSVKSDYVTVEALHQTELLMRRDISNICTQMAEMRDVIYLTRDNIIEANTATGEVSRTLVFENRKNSAGYESQVKELEDTHNLLMAIKNFIIPKTLMNGEMYVHIVPFAKLFAELEIMQSRSMGADDTSSVFKESIPNYITESFHGVSSLYTEDNVSYLMESVSPGMKSETSAEYKIDNEKSYKSSDSIAQESVSELLKSIDVYTGSSTMMAELGADGFKELVYREYVETQQKLSMNDKNDKNKFDRFMESFLTEETGGGGSLFNKIDQEDIDTKSYSKIKGCYIKYMDSLKMVPIRMDRRIVGYYYVTTTMDLQHNTVHPNGIVDLSFQHYTRDKNMVDKLASMIIKSFDKKMLERNVKLKNEIVDVIMAHKFAEGKLSFVYIPENEIVRFAIDEDEEGRGHSIIEPSIFSARSYLLLDMYNKLYILNNNTTRVHYLKSSGLNKNYAAQIQRTMRKFQARRITIDDVFSFSGALNKIGGISEMVLPAGRGDYKALETDTIEAARNPFDTDYLEQQRRQALSGTGAPHLLMINALEEVDFAKTVELANARYQSRCSGFKIDFNKGNTLMYQKIMKYSTDIEDDVIKSFKFKFNESKQHDLNITTDMINNFNSAVEVAMAIYGNKSTWEDGKGNPSHKQINLRKALARKYLPQLDIDELDEIMKQVELDSQNDELHDRVAEIDIDDEDLKEISGGKGKKNKKQE